LWLLAVAVGLAVRLVMLVVLVVLVDIKQHRGLL
jgi:hypothetical protein